MFARYTDYLGSAVGKPHRTRYIFVRKITQKNGDRQI